MDNQVCSKMQFAVEPAAVPGHWCFGDLDPSTKTQRTSISIQKDMIAKIPGVVIEMDASNGWQRNSTTTTNVKTLESLSVVQTCTSTLGSTLRWLLRRCRGTR